MSIYLRSKILILFFCGLNSTQVALAEEYGNAYLLFQSEDCIDSLQGPNGKIQQDAKMQNRGNNHSLANQNIAMTSKVKVCKATSAANLGFSRALINRSAEGTVLFLAPTMTAEEDSIELICYRCAFGKIEKSKCGRFKEIHGKKTAAENCPKP